MISILPSANDCMKSLEIAFVSQLEMRKENAKHTQGHFQTRLSSSMDKGDWQYLYYENLGILWNHWIISVPTGCQLKIEIPSLDPRKCNQGVWT